ncbi:hypothetical protein Nepgr_006774 [Nepenthes gracilis]|uniref:Uncharacterized protein n=1 Tax=Nepenthes gracilis TaxID=150966 RepID=A0AAD3XHP0_NEPGR|nr:hypothetical protein Nepgr_006774 [Nepenthes gracilis]
MERQLHRLNASNTCRAHWKMSSNSQQCGPNPAIYFSSQESIQHSISVLRAIRVTEVFAKPGFVDWYHQPASVYNCPALLGDTIISCTAQHFKVAYQGKNTILQYPRGPRSGVEHHTQPEQREQASRRHNYQQSSSKITPFETINTWKKPAPQEHRAGHRIHKQPASAPSL